MDGSDSRALCMDGQVCFCWRGWIVLISWPHGLVGIRRRVYVRGGGLVWVHGPHERMDRRVLVCWHEFPVFPA